MTNIKEHIQYILLDIRTYSYILTGKSDDVYRDSYSICMVIALVNGIGSNLPQPNRPNVCYVANI